jgi:hypothetical protein
MITRRRLCAKNAKPAKLAKAFLGMFFVVFANFAILVNRAVSPCIRTKYSVLSTF